MRALDTESIGFIFRIVRAGSERRCCEIVDFYPKFLKNRQFRMMAVSRKKDHIPDPFLRDGIENLLSFFRCNIRIVFRTPLQS